LENLQNTHDEDLKLIENLRKDHDKSSKAAEDLRINNADLAKTLSGKEQKIQDLDKALADRDETSRKEITKIKNKLKLLFGFLKSFHLFFSVDSRRYARERY
jgi:hypothetical protein